MEWKGTLVGVEVHFLAGQQIVMTVREVESSLATSNQNLIEISFSDLADIILATRDRSFIKIWVKNIPGHVRSKYYQHFFLKFDWKGYLSNRMGRLKYYLVCETTHCQMAPLGRQNIKNIYLWKMYEDQQNKNHLKNQLWGSSYGRWVEGGWDVVRIPQKLEA